MDETISLPVRISEHEVARGCSERDKTPVSGDGGSAAIEAAAMPVPLVAERIHAHTSSLSCEKVMDEDVVFSVRITLHEISRTRFKRDMVSVRGDGADSARADSLGSCRMYAHSFRSLTEAHASEEHGADE